MSKASIQPATQPATDFARTLAVEMRGQIYNHLALVKSVEDDRLQTTQQAAQQEAENALSMALHYLRKGAGNVPGAMRKTVQAMGAMNTLQAAAGAVRQGGAA